MKNDPIFAAMKAQLTPSQGAQEALLEALQAPILPTERENRGKITKKPGLAPALALAACAALVLCAWPVSRLLAAPGPKLHSYTLVEGLLPAGGNTQSKLAAADDEGDVEAGTITGRELGDHDVAMSPGALRGEMAQSGFADADIDAYLSGGRHMTWALWHSYAGGADLDTFVAYTRENQAWIDRIIADYGLDEEDGLNTGDLPNPPGEDIPAQPGADAYQLLMDHFGGTLPDWYGGAYVTDGGNLMVLLVSDRDPGDKSLELEVLEAAGGKTAPVAFAGAKYSRSELNRLNEEILLRMEGRELASGWGIYDDQNCIIMDLFEVPPDDLLADLAKLDPDGDAIRVQVVKGGIMVNDGPASIDAIGEEDGGGVDAVRRLPGGATVGEDSGLDMKAIEPHVGNITDLPEKKQPALETAQPADYDLLTLEPQAGKGERVPFPAVEDAEPVGE